MFIIGTAQLCSNYGIMNKSNPDTKNILEYCEKHNITRFDTARCYGESEKALKCINKKEVTTKLTHINNNIEQVDKNVMESYENLGVLNLLLHNVNDYYNKCVWNRLLYFKEQGIIKKLGVSIYKWNEIKNIIYDSHIEIIQIPFNILNAKEWVELKKIKMYERPELRIDVRSIYLQGLLLGDINDWKKIGEEEFYLQKIAPLKITTNKLISFVKKQKWIDGIIFGIDNVKQLEENYNLYLNSNDDFEIEIENVDRISDPRQWKIV